MPDRSNGFAFLLKHIKIANLLVFFAPKSLANPPASYETERGENRMFMSTVTVLTSGTFEDFIRQPLAVVDFWAPWCGPCRSLAPVLDKIAQEQNIPVGKVNVEESETETLVKKYNIRSIPALFFFKNGQQVDNHVGMLSEEELLNKIRSL